MYVSLVHKEYDKVLATRIVKKLRKLAFQLFILDTVKWGYFVYKRFNIKTRLINNLANSKISKKFGLRNLWMKLAIQFAFL